uniref:Peptidyl-prolyl cis-trans isomerase n=1 Tax=Fagus sylvatica TaxID=28930 RepID=A0A2N9H3U3_FAGSY
MLSGGGAVIAVVDLMDQLEPPDLREQILLHEESASQGLGSGRSTPSVPGGAQSAHGSTQIRIRSTQIHSDRKRKKTSISSADRTAEKDKDKDKHKHHHHHKKKKTRMSSSTSNQVRASHILVKHQGSRRKASWKDPEGRVIMNTNRETAVSQLKAYRDDIVSGKAKFEDLASRFSDCNSAKRGGDLGPFGRGQMQKPFEEATYALKVGDISDIVDTDSGVHIILRTG